MLSLRAVKEIRDGQNSKNMASFSIVKTTLTTESRTSLLLFILPDALRHGGAHEINKQFCFYKKRIVLKIGDKLWNEVEVNDILIYRTENGRFTMRCWYFL